MPLCFCVSNGCNISGGVDSVTGKARGVKQDSRTYKTHSLEDKRAVYLAAEQKADDVLEDQIQEIAAHLAATVLADQASGPSEDPESFLWSRGELSANPDSPKFSLHSPHCTSPSNNDRPQSSSNLGSPKTFSHPPRQPNSRRSREEDTIKCLSDLEGEVNTFVSKCMKNLEHVGFPPFGPLVPFPLLDSLEMSSTFKSRLETITIKSPSVLSLRDCISRKLDANHVQLKKAKELWIQRSSDIKLAKTPFLGIPYDTARHFKPIFSSADPVLQVTLFMVVACHVVLGVSRRGCSFLLKMVQYIVHLTLHRTGPDFSQGDQKLLSDFPVDPRAAEKALLLENKHTIFAVCPNPNCHFNYKPQFENGSPIPIYPKTCNHREFSQGRKCGTLLLKPRRIGNHMLNVPIKPFISFSFRDWLGGILSRLGYEEKMDGVWKSWIDGSLPTDIKDIFDGEILQNFMGIDGKHFSLGGEEGRYVFSLGVDFFNPLGNKQAGKKKSIGMISLICLNIPPDMRYKPENMFLYGVVPGPNEPPLTCLNHYITELVNELLDFWHTGIRYSRTGAFYFGRLVRCALICVVCDLLAARKVNGFASIKHKETCALCHCKCRPKDDPLNDSFATIAERRTAEEIRESSQEYLDASNEKERQAVVDATGIRWSELYRLPYFDPSRFVVVDAMHNLFLGLVNEHFDILGIRADAKVPDAIPSISINIQPILISRLKGPEQKSLARLIKLLESPINAELMSQEGYDSYVKRLNSIHRLALELACNALSVTFVEIPGANYTNKKAYNKADYIRSLLAWRLQQTETSQPFTNGFALSAEEKSQLHSDIFNMTTPSWLSPVPSNLGEASHGKLKADQWRTLGMIYLPVSLIRMWGSVEPDDNRSKLLVVTLSLMAAVIIASSRTTSKQQANLYQHYIQNYLTGIRELFPQYKFRPNHHMALHLGEYLTFYGPIRYWWTYPFERLIGLLQRIPNNFQIGRLEETMSMSFTKSANFRAILLKEGCPQAVRHCNIYFQKLTDPEVRNTLLSDISQLGPVVEHEDDDEEDSWDLMTMAPIPKGPYQALHAYLLGKDVPRTAKVLSCQTINGITFSTFTRHKGNSLVLVRRPSLPSIPARIETMLQISPDEILYGVRYFGKCASNDIFQTYPVFRISTWSTEGGKLVIINPDDIEVHFACLALGSNEMAVISLSKDNIT